MGQRRDRAFTLIEAMIVVVIVGISSLLAVVAYRRWIVSSKLMEAENMIENIRSAEEAFKSENGGYLTVSKGIAGSGTTTPNGDYPAATPGSFKTQWGADCTTCVATNSWRQLAVVAGAPVYYGYAVVASNDPNAAPDSILVNGAAFSLSAMKGTPWFVVEADGDPLGSGKFTKLFGVSNNNQVFINNDTN
jgi:prepilin-type N-terminal cleavage/methylation domain-containing protein